MGAEDMLVQLTERNLLLGEVIIYACKDVLRLSDLSVENRRDENRNRGP